MGTTFEPEYPRDLVGYGRHAPHPDWPGGARIAVQFVLNYEEGAENCVLHGDKASEAFLSEIIGAAPLAGARHMNMESIYEFGSRAGVWRLLNAFEQRHLPLTIFAVGMALARNPEAAASLAHRLHGSGDIATVAWEQGAIAREGAHAAIVVNATSAGLGSLPFDPKALPAACLVVDVRYQPRPVDEQTRGFVFRKEFRGGVAFRIGHGE